MKWDGQEIETDVSNFLSDSFAIVTACGSRVTCNPPPTDTDRDFLVVTADACEAAFVAELKNLGFNCEGYDQYQQTSVAGGFKSWRRGDLNLIVTSDDVFAERHRAATYVCTRLNVLDKSDRIAIFQAVLYGRIWT